MWRPLPANEAQLTPYSRISISYAPVMPSRSAYIYSRRSRLPRAVYGTRRCNMLRGRGRLISAPFRYLMSTACYASAPLCAAHRSALGHWTRGHGCPLRRRMAIAAFMTGTLPLSRRAHLFSLSFVLCLVAQSHTHTHTQPRYCSTLDCVDIIKSVGLYGRCSRRGRAAR